MPAKPPPPPREYVWIIDQAAIGAALPAGSTAVYPRPYDFWRRFIPAWMDVRINGRRQVRLSVTGNVAFARSADRWLRQCAPLAAGIVRGPDLGRTKP